MAVRIIVEVRGGLAQVVHCSDPGASVDVIDWDNVEAEPEASEIEAENQRLYDEAKGLHEFTL